MTVMEDALAEGLSDAGSIPARSTCGPKRQCERSRFGPFSMQKPEFMTVHYPFG